MISKFAVILRKRTRFGPWPLGYQSVLCCLLTPEGPPNSLKVNLSCELYAITGGGFLDYNLPGKFKERPQMTDTSLEKCESVHLARMQPAARPTLVAATDEMIRGILRDNFTHWTPGLKLDRYCHYQRWQFSRPWARKNLSYWALLQDEDVVSSCKLYEMNFRSRSKDYKIGGIGAVFTAERNRGKGWGHQLLEQMKDLCLERGYDAVMLNSDIDPAYYEKVGYESLSSRDFAIRVTEESVRRTVRDLDRRFCSGRDERLKVRDATPDDVPSMVRHHSHWLVRRPFGLLRSDEYWSFKLGREMYLHQHSSLGWPKQELITLNFEKSDGGYVLFEQGPRAVRVLEVVGSEETEQSLWAQLLQLALKRKTPLLRGWEGTAPEAVKGVHSSGRIWSRPMILPLTNELSVWAKQSPCPLVEMDHY
jgi:predicted N-acetyltransferase YhbS